MADCERIVEGLPADEVAEARALAEEAARRSKLEHPDAWRERLQEMMDKVADESAEAMEIDRRNTYLNQRAQVAMFNYLQTNWPDNPARGLQALLTGDEVARAGSHASVASSQGALLNRYVTGFLGELETQGVLRTLTSGEFDLQIRQAMWELDQPNPNTAGMQADVIKVAEVMRRYNDMTRMDANTAGANIGKINGYAVRQSHDLNRMHRAGFESWFEKVDNLLDYDRTFADLEKGDAKGLLRTIYNGLVSGSHLKHVKPKTTGLKGIGNIGKSMSKERVLHFKSAEAEHDYAQAFGTGSLSESMVAGMHVMAQNTALMRRMGPNAQQNFDSVTTQISNKLNLENKVNELTAFDGKVREMQKTTMPNLTGEARVSGNHMAARVNQSVRNLQNIIKLGGAVLSAITDLPLMASELRYSQGVNMFSGLADSIKGLFRGKTKPEEKQLMGMLGVMYNHLSDSASARYDIATDGVPGAFSKANQMFFKLNMLTPWTDKLRSAFTLGISNRLDNLKGQRWANLPAEVSRGLRQFNIDEGKWDIIRRVPSEKIGEHNYLTPEGISDLTDEAFVAYIEAQGKTATRLRIQELKTEITDQFRSYFFDRSTTAVLEPNTRTKATLMRGTQPGSLEGEALRHVMQFKSFPATAVQRVIKREIFGHGEDTTLKAALKNGQGNLVGLAHLIGWTTAFGYGAMALKDLAKGREPRTPENTADFGKILVASMLQGGALGIYGDFLFGEAKSRYGQSPIGTLAGPLVSDVESVYDIYAKVMTGDDASGQALNTLYKMIPGNNLFYTKLATDYLIFNELKELANPGHTARMVERARRENDQEYFLPPSSVWD
jgi:hypothetical protein